MGSTGFDSLRQSVLEALAAVSLSTEQVYQRMGDAFPRLVRELDVHFGSASDAGRDPLSETVAATLATIADHDRLYTQAHRESDEMLAQLEQQLVALGRLGECIGDIREDSVLMELISLNAMVIAVKAGESGRAFSCITGELKQLSNQTMGLTDQIAAGEQALDRVFGEFKADLKRLNASEQALLNAFLARVREVFEGLNQGASGLLAGLEAIRRRTDEVKAPLVRIVVEIQNQDRIRQGIDHVLLSLREFQDIDESDPLEEQLDEVSFLEILPELSSQVLEEIAGQIAENRAAFHRSLADAGRLIEALERERAAFLAEHLESRREGSLEHWFQAGERSFEDFVSQSEGASRSREYTFRRSSVLQRNVADLVDSLRSFDVLLSKFRNIDLASRIQVARQAALASMKDNASEMSALTRKIEKDVGTSISITSAFFSTVEALFQSYRGQFGQRVKQDEAFHQQLRSTMANLRSSKQFLNQQVRESRVFSQTFTELFARTEADLSTLDQLLDALAQQKRHLAEIRTKVVEKKRQIMAAHGVSEWKLESQKLKSMIDRFTIFTHKQIAAELGDFEVEQAVASGDVTLF